MKKTIVTMLFIVCASMLFAKPPVGRGPKQGEGEHPHMNGLVRLAQNPKMAEKMGITAEQSAKISEACKPDSDVAETQKKLQAAMKNQVELLNAQSVDKAAVMASIDEVFKLRKMLAKAQMKKVIAVRSILTPEQIKKASEAMKEFRNRKPDGKKMQGGKRPEAAKKMKADKKATVCKKAKDGQKAKVCKKAKKRQSKAKGKKPAVMAQSNADK